MKRNAVIALAVIASALLGFAVGQDPVQSEAQKLRNSIAYNETMMQLVAVRLALQPSSAEARPGGSNHAKFVEVSRGMAKAWLMVPATPDATEEMVCYILEDYTKARAGAKSAVQVSQAADEAQIRARTLELAQNARIIALLEKLVAAKK